MTAKQYLDTLLPQLEALKENKTPDCYMIYRLSFSGVVIGEPVAIYKHKKSLYKNFSRLSKETPDKFGITVGVWWFDD
jgi:hypothetical protein